MTNSSDTQNIEKPSRDPRENMPAPILRSDVLDMKDLKPGMVLKGTVRNVIDFGCFVELWEGCEGFLHVSQIAHERVEKPSDMVSVGDEIIVMATGYDKRGKLNLSRKDAIPAPAKKEDKKKEETE